MRHFQRYPWPMRPLIALLIFAALSLPAAERRDKIGEPGKFDYYLLALSWSPAYCADRPSNNDPQCAAGRRFSFVLHGLWPQYSKRVENSYWPQFCTDEQGLRDPKPMLDIMPSTKLVRHEWDKHGTCTGLNPQGYFDLARKAYQTIRIPARFVALTQYLNISPEEVKKEFLAANASAPASAFVIACNSNFLSEVRVCLDRNLKPIPCQGQRECRAPKVRMPPVR